MLNSLLLTIRFFILVLSGHKHVALESVALRHQLAVFYADQTAASRAFYYRRSGNVNKSDIVAQLDPASEMN